MSLFYMLAQVDRVTRDYEKSWGEFSRREDEFFEKHLERLHKATLMTLNEFKKLAGKEEAFMHKVNMRCKFYYANRWIPDFK